MVKQQHLHGRAKGTGGAGAGRGQGGGRAEAGRGQGEGGRTGREVHVRGSSYARVDVYKLHGNKLLLVLKTYISTK